MPLDPDAESLLATIKAGGRPPMTSLTPAEARASNAASRALLQPDPPDVARVRDLEAPGPEGSVPVRLYLGLGAPTSKAPTLVFAHGGGWVLGDRDSHDYLCRRLANDARCAVASIDYRLAPEHKFPAALLDSLGASQWLADEAEGLGLDADRFAVGGDSAGGTISAALALMARDGVAPAFVHQLLLYAPLDMAMDGEAFERVSGDHPVSPAVARWFRDHYLADPADEADWRASPLRAASHAGVAPAFILTVRHDPFCDDGRAYALALEDAGVRVWHLDMNDELHAFLTWGKKVRAAETVIDMVAASLRYAFADPTT